jgi:hypothetical protein
MGVTELGGWAQGKYPLTVKTSILRNGQKRSEFETELKSFGYSQ